MLEISNKHITKPLSAGADGLGLCDGQEFHLHDCYIDLSCQDLDKIDEALGITWGSHGLVERCVIRGAGKLILCGCGDDDKVALETGKTVTFADCILEHGGRRFPEVQDGMEVTLRNCLVQNWGQPDRFDTRSFGAWAHNGGWIRAENCVFRQDTTSMGFRLWLADKIGHVGQAINEDGIKALFSAKTYIAGPRRALTAGHDGYVQAMNCWWDDDLVVENDSGYMTDKEAASLIAKLEQMRAGLKLKLGI